MGIYVVEMSAQTASETAIQVINARFEALDYLADAADFVKFDLKLINFAQYRSEAGDFSVGHLHCVASTIVLHLGRRLGLLGELRNRQRFHPIDRTQTCCSLRIAIAAVSSTSDDRSGRRAPADWWDPGVIGLG